MSWTPENFGATPVSLSRGREDSVSSTESESNTVLNFSNENSSIYNTNPTFYVGANNALFESQNFEKLSHLLYSYLA